MQQKLKFQDTLEYLISYKEVYTGLGRRCLMCGMVLEFDQDKFCCEDCEDQYIAITN